MQGVAVAAPVRRTGRGRFQLERYYQRAIEKIKEYAQKGREWVAARV
jgi:hypothetical protein